MLVFLGMLLDTESQVVCMPYDKVLKALDQVRYFTNIRNKNSPVWAEVV